MGIGMNPRSWGMFPRLISQCRTLLDLLRFVGLASETTLVASVSTVSMGQDASGGRAMVTGRNIWVYVLAAVVP